MKKTRWLILLLGLAPCVFAQATGPTRDLNGNMVGEVEPLKYITQTNTLVNLDTYKDYMTWGAVYPICDDPANPHKSNHTAYYSTKKISTVIGTATIQHCHGPGGPGDPGVLTNIGNTAFTWSNGQLFPRTSTSSKSGFYSDHFVRHYIPVVAGQRISARIWLATAAPSPFASPWTAFRIDYYPGWNGVGTQPDNSTRTNVYEFQWENNTGVRDHAYTFNFNPPFTGTIALDVGPDLVTNVQNWGAVWLKALTLQDGRSDGIVPLGSYSPARFEPQYYIKFRHSGKVMVPDFWTGYNEDEPSVRPGETVKQRTLDVNNKNQRWYIHPSSTPGFSNIWTKHGALTSGPYWWEARSLTKPTLNDIWQQVQFVDQGNGYKRIRLGGKGPAGEDLYLTNYDNEEGSDVAVYFGGIGGQDVELIQVSGPVPGVPYKVQYVHSNKCLAVSAASTANGAAVVQQTCTGGSHQKLTLGTHPGGYYSLKFVHSAKMVDIEGGSTANGAYAIQWPYHGGNNQQFALYAHNDGTYSFAYKHSGKCVDISGNSTADGARALQWPCHWNNNQRFRFVP